MKYTGSIGRLVLGATLAMACGTPSDGGDETADPDDSGNDTTSTTSATTMTPPGTTSTTSTPMTSVSASGTTAMGTSTGAPGSSSAAETAPPIFLDLGQLPDGPIIDEACGAVDFLFVIDNSGSMADEQMNLVASFPGFISAIQGTLDQVNAYNIGIVTSDAYSPNTVVPGCNVLGGLVNQTGGGDSSNMICGPYAAGTNYMTEADDLATAFACAAQVGTSGDFYELMMDAALAAIDVDGPLHAPGACNEGFLREDALLVLVIITDEYDGMGDPEPTYSMGTPMDWYDAVVAAKDGIPENVVVVSLVNAMGGSCPPASTVFDGVNIVDFTNMFGDNGLVGGVCDPDYSLLFAEAVEVIDVACDNFMPPN